MAPPGWSPSSIRGTAARTRACPAETLKRKASSRNRGDVSSSGLGMVPPMLLTTMSSRPSSLKAVSASEAMRSKSVRSPGTTMARRPVASTCFATAAQLVLGAGGQDDVGTRFGQGDSCGGADAAPAGGDDGDLVGDEESIEDHPANVAGRPARHAESGQAGQPGSDRHAAGRRLRPLALPVRATRSAQPIWSSRTGKGLGMTLALTSSGEAQVAAGVPRR